MSTFPRFPPIPKASVLDVRELDAARSRPFLDAANIPLSELSLRIHELPPKGATLPVVAAAELAVATAELLAAHGRTCRFVDGLFSPDAYCTGRLWDPNELVVDAVRELPPGRALDLGCGTGRDAVYLAAAGWEVVAVDVLPDALARGRLTAERFGCADRIDFVPADAGSFEPEGSFDLVLMAFFLDRAGLKRAIASLSPRGHILMEVFTPTHRDSLGTPRNPALTLGADDGKLLLADMQLLRCEEAWRGNRHTLRVVARGAQPKR